MKRDRFEELLKEKLDRVEVRPPADMWAKLEERLPEIRRELAFGEGASQGAGDALPAPKIRKPFRRKMKWAYVAASVGVVAAMIFSLSNLQQEDILVGDSVMPVIVPEADPRSGLPDSPEPDGMATTAATGRKGGTGSYIAGRTMRTGESQTANGDLAPAVNMPGTPDDSKNDGVSNRTTGDTTDATREGTKEQPREKASEGKVWEGSGMTLEEWQRNRTRRSSRVSTSLFAMNATGTNNPNGTIRSQTKLQKSSYWVVETDNSPGEEDEEKFLTRSAAGSTTSGPNNKLKHDLPLSFGASVNIGITGRVSIETGLSYTYMNSKMTQVYGGGNAVVQTKQRLHYLGIPVKVKYDFMQTRFIDLYASAGGALDKLVSGKVTSEDKVEGQYVENSRTEKKIKVGSLQASVGANVGAEFNIDKNFGLYVEPGVGYFFKNDNQPDSYRTENPFNFTIKAGVRIKL